MNNSLVRPKLSISVKKGSEVDKTPKNNENAIIQDNPNFSDLNKDNTQFKQLLAAV